MVIALLQGFSVKKIIALICLAAVLSACSNDSENGQITPPVLRNWEENVFFNSTNYSDRCANPRSGTNPLTGAPVADRQGRVVDENNWLRSIHNEFYLWYQDINDQDPGLFSSPTLYFPELRSQELSETMSGQDKDRFHTFENTEVLANRILSGIQPGYGVHFVIQGDIPNREVHVAYVEDGSSAAAQGFARGTQVLTVDGETIATTNNVEALLAGLFPESVGETHNFTIRQLDTSETSTSLTSADITLTPVRFAGAVAGTNIGYILFNEHVATAESLLIDAINLLNSLNANQDVIIDLRYNSGGILDIASEFAYMVAGDEATTRENETGKTFERFSFNDRFTDLPFNPLNGSSLIVPFYDEVIGFSENLTPDEPLPSLNAQRVVVITSAESCSASESFINGLLGAEVTVFQMGTTTCGKPYGTLPLDNCGTTYLFTQFEGFNELDNGGFELSDGFTPGDNPAVGVGVPGCIVEDDFANALGDPAEANIANAINYLQNAACLAPPVVTTSQTPSIQSSNTKPALNSTLQNPNRLNTKIIF